MELRNTHLTFFPQKEGLHVSINFLFDYFYFFSMDVDKDIDLTNFIISTINLRSL